MAVYKQTYKGYSGRRTAGWSRLFILTRYGCAPVFGSKIMAVLLAGALFYPLLGLAYIYLAHNASFLALFSIPVDQLFAIDGRFFYYFCMAQGAWAYLLAALIGPGLVSPDLANGAMPLYFCRPFSRVEYVLGKLNVLLLLLSLITWVPGLVLFLINAMLEGWDWFAANWWLAESIFLGSMLWIIVLGLIALAASAWVKWRLVAGALILGVFFAGAGFGAAVNQVMRTSYGSLLDLTEVVHTIWADLFRFDSGSEMSLQSAWLVLAATAGICCWLMARRIRPFEIIK